MNEAAMAFQLRRLTLDETDQAAAIHRTAFDASLPWLAGLHTPEEDRAFFREQVFARCALWGAFDGAMFGFIAFRAGWVDQLYILPAQQRRGAGRALLAIAKSAHPSLALWTFQRNHAARRFYEAQDFTVERETDGSGNEEREPDVLYLWRTGT